MSLPFRSEAGDGLLGVVTRAQQTVLSQTEDPIGVLGIELAEDSGIPGLARLSIEAAYGEHLGQGVIERLDVSFGGPALAAPTSEELRRLLADFGGTGFTSICLHEAAGERELVDVTLHFSQKLPILSHCVALSADDLSADEMRDCQAVLASLGLKASAKGACLDVARRQLRRRLTRDEQVSAFERALAAGLCVELYAATLPVTRAVRVTARPAGEGRFDVACTLSRRLEVEQTSAARDAVALKDYLTERFGFDFGDKSWTVDNAHGERSEHRPHGPMGSRKPMQWSLNFGEKKR